MLRRLRNRSLTRRPAWGRPYTPFRISKWIVRNTIAARQANATEETEKIVHYLLDNCSTYRNDGITYHTSNMILCAHSDAGFNNETNESLPCPVEQVTCHTHSTALPNCWHLEVVEFVGEFIYKVGGLGCSLLLIFFWTVYFYYTNFYSCTRYKLLCNYDSSSSSDTDSEEE